MVDIQVVYELEEEGGYHVYAPALKGCHSWGATKKEARQKIIEAIELWLDSALDLGIEVYAEIVTVVPSRK